ncbi:hypothetical protein CCB80_05500 [Armatimonadetes bacterium Uphvl-Ar1]|nr:hypothetical protein CCB80_05500 [Armatimonadetes bacterium Uphvl-Ar1]
MNGKSDSIQTDQPTALISNSPKTIKHSSLSLTRKVARRGLFKALSVNKPKKSGKPGRLNNVSAKRGFTLVEVLVAAVLLAVGITALVGAISGLMRAERAVAEKDFIDRIAHEKLQELIATQAWQSEAGGTFDDERLRDYTWSLQESNVGVENLTGLTLTVSSQNKGENSISTVVFTAPAPTGTAEGGGT